MDFHVVSHRQTADLAFCYCLNSLRSFRNGTHLEALHRNFLNLGHTFSFWILGSPVVTSCDPDNVRTILATSQNDFDSGTRRRAALAPIIGRGIFAVDGSEWRHARALMRPAFARKNTQDFGMLERHFQALLTAISSAGLKVDLQNLFFKMTMDTATDMLTGKSVDSLTSDDTEVNEFMLHWDTATSYIKFLTFTGPLGRWIPMPKVVKAKKYLFDYLETLISSRLQQDQSVHPQDLKSPLYVFLDALSEHTQDAKLISDQTLSALAGGRDTTASLLSNLFFVLSRREDIWQKVRTEAATMLGSDTPADAVGNATYLRWCINECKHDQQVLLPITLPRLFH